MNRKVNLEPRAESHRGTLSQDVSKLLTAKNRQSEGTEKKVNIGNRN